MTLSRKLLAVPAATAVLMMAGAPAMASSDDAWGEAMADLQPVPLNDAPGSGSAMIEVNGTTIDFTLAYQGLLADAPHAAHIHFDPEARHGCPTAEDDTDGDGFLTTTEGGPAYGGIRVSLTTEGDTSPDSGLAVDRFGVGDDVSYSRGGIEVDQETADAILAGQAVVVVHGVDHDGSGAYDEGDRGASDLDPSLPGEATDPALCGVAMVSQMEGGVPGGGVDTGEAAPGGANMGLAAAGGMALLGGALMFARRRTADQA